MAGPRAPIGSLSQHAATASRLARGGAFTARISASQPVPKTKGRFVDSESESESSDHSDSSASSDAPGRTNLNPDNNDWLTKPPFYTSPKPAGTTSKVAKSA